MSRNATQPDSTSPDSDLPEGESSTGGPTLRRRVTITNPHGFHMRPATVFAQLAGGFQSSISLSKEGRRVNGKSPLELLFLAAEQGTEIDLEVCGDDAAIALDALTKVLEAPSADDLP